MKKNLLVLAALSVVALPFLFSCGKPNDPDKPAETVVMQDPPTKDAAIKIEFHEDKPRLVIFKSLLAVIRKITAIITARDSALLMFPVPAATPMLM